MQKSRILKFIISMMLFLVIMLCFTFNAFAIDMPLKLQDPQIVIDGLDVEPSWMESSRVIFSTSPEIADMASVETLNYKNTVYGIVNFTDVVDNDSEFIVRIDFHYKKYNTYIIFLMKKQMVLYGDGDISVESAMNENEIGYCAEFSFSVKNNVFAHGDLVQLEISYGNIGEVDDYESVYGFADRKSYDYYIGGELPEASGNVKPKPNPNSSSSSSNTKTTKSSTVNAVTVTTNLGVEQFKDYGYTDAAETSVIICVMAAACVVLLIVTLVARKPNEGQRPNYTDDDKGCD